MISSWYRFYNSKVFLSHILEITRVLQKLVLALSRWTCNTIYQNSNKVDIFCSSLFFQQAPADVSMSSRSRVTAGFVKTVAHTPPENEGCKKKQTKKWKEYSTFGSMASVRGTVSALFGVKKENMVSEHMEMMCFQTVCQHVNKKWMF